MSLESRSQERTFSDLLQKSLNQTIKNLPNPHGVGMTIYPQEWRTQVTPSQRQISQRRVSAPRISGIEHSLEQRELRGWPTPLASDNGNPYKSVLDFRGTLPSGIKTMLKLTDAVYLVMREPNVQISDSHGKILTGCLDRTGLGDRLNPEHSRWIMGYPKQWSCSMDTEML